MRAPRKARLAQGAICAGGYRLLPQKHWLVMPGTITWCPSRRRTLLKHPRRFLLLNQRLLCPVCLRLFHQPLKLGSTPPFADRIELAMLLHLYPGLRRPKRMATKLPLRWITCLQIPYPSSNHSSFVRMRSVCHCRSRMAIPPAIRIIPTPGTQGRSDCLSARPVNVSNTIARLRAYTNNLQCPAQPDPVHLYSVCPPSAHHLNCLPGHLYTTNARCILSAPHVRSLYVFAFATGNESFAHTFHFVDTPRYASQRLGDGVIVHAIYPQHQRLSLLIYCLLSCTPMLAPKNA
jgi:hypothetical protein